MEREFPSACHVDRILINKEIVKEVLIHAFLRII